MFDIIESETTLFGTPRGNTWCQYGDTNEYYWIDWTNGQSVHCCQGKYVMVNAF